MSTTSSAADSPQDPETDEHYDEFLAAVQSRFQTVIAAARPPAKVHLFTTQSPALFEVFLAALPASLRQFYKCSACRKFVDHYGGIVRVAADGTTIPVLWDPEFAMAPYTSAIRELADVVERAPITGVFLSEDKSWGRPQTGDWHHLAITPPAALTFVPSAVQTASQAVAEKRQDYETLLRGLTEFPLPLVSQAYSLLTTDALYRSEKCIGVAKWLVELHEQRQATQNLRTRENVTWRAVASAPAGFCHVRSSMIGTLLEDLTAGLPFAQLKAKFDAKMSPIAYQRPVAAPTTGNIARAEKIIDKLKSAGALERRFAKLADLQTLWAPAPKSEPEKKGVFSHLKGLATPAAAPVGVPPITMTWEKFARTVLPTAEAISYLVPAGKQSYVALVTAKNPDAPAIIQWDSEGKRNPVTWYFYLGGSTPARWNLKEGVYQPVTAITLQPSMWNAPKDFAHQGEKVIFVLKDAKDLEYQQSSGFFPEFLKSEYHEIRATIEAYAKNAVIEGKDVAEACGIGLQKGTAWNYTFRVVGKGGMRVDYKLDRWD